VSVVVGDPILSEELDPGTHESLVTQKLSARIERARQDGKIVDLKAIDDQVLADVLARHLHDRAREWIDRVPASTPARREVQIALANRLLRELNDPGASGEHELELAAAFLLEVAHHAFG